MVERFEGGWEHEVWVRPLKIVSGGNSVMERSYFSGKIIGWVLESKLVSQLLGVVHLSSPSLDYEDKWVWKDGVCAAYSVNSTYGFLKGVLEEESSSLYNFCWKILALPSIHITALRVLENKIATKVNLARREITVDSTVCCFCKEKEETTSRLFFECRVA
ncbi:uncharacterized protein [Phaseolus vulgaris]|uniref:uncharacterized protein n=1 Tax=Phaseolus vulgaris TaxID=3885 RepID=UPI0035CC4A4D